ncbi:hypothetical protein ABZ920_27185 [Streptomyces sp. NPDC046831]|uniref:hypothetical protein n=1 Tax=Streptomyces sp. NPDC046831 TaxID=3154805 RepID=UPI0033C0970F
MPFPSPPRALTGPRRRSLLASAAGGALLVGCAGGSGDPGGADPSAAERARARAARDSRGLRERYDAVIAAHPALAERLRPLRAEVARHEGAFGAAGASPTASEAPAVPAGPEGASASAPDAAGAGASPSVSAAVPPNEKDALAALAAAERSLADRRTTALLGVPGELARLLASVAAAGAAHAYLLTEGAK